MKALSVKQPWANLIASGRKTIETRTWSTSYRGPLLIVSSKKPNVAPAGSAVAIANLVACRCMTSADEAAACCQVYPKAVSWILVDLQKIRPFPVRALWACSIAQWISPTLKSFDRRRGLRGWKPKFRATRPSSGGAVHSRPMGAIKTTFRNKNNYTCQ